MARRPAAKVRTVTATPAPISLSEGWTTRPSGLAIPYATQLAIGSYRAAENPRRRFRVTDGTGDYHLDDITRRKMRAQSRDLERNNDLYDGFLGNVTTYVVGSGPRPIFTTPDEAWNTKAQELFKADAAACRLDGRRLFSWPIWCAMLVRALLRDGEIGTQHLDDGSGLLLESERVVSVQTDAIGRVIGYRTAVLGPDGNLRPNDPGTPIAAQHLTLTAWRNRPSQTRGLTPLNAGLDDWERIDSLNESEIISAEAASLPWMVVKHQAGHTAPLKPPVAGSTASSYPGPAAPSGWVRGDAGNILGLPPGLDGQPWAPNRPNLNVPEFVRMQLRHLCNPVLPYEVAFLDLGDLNYAAIRALGRLAQRKIADLQTLHVEPVISRVVRDWARAQILAKRLPFNPAFAAFRWDWDRLEIRDREKDATAVEREMANGTTTLQDELGPTWRETVAQRDAEERAEALAAIARVAQVQELVDQANEANPKLKLHWSHILTLGGATTAPGAYLAAAAPAPAAAPTDAANPGPVAQSMRVERDAAGRIVSLSRT